MVTIEDLEQQGLIRKLPLDPKAVENAIGLARRDITVASTVLAGNRDWAYTIAYNAMLQAARALMFSKGYRPSGNNQHITVVRFAEQILGTETVAPLERMRRRRHVVVYDMAGTVSDLEAENAVSRAEMFFGIIENLLH
ncbi:HEPN domain-containing protein [Methanoculleus sp. YWC-01]|uniref:HEPN domain-containing protein n=1 Tax=Methanoculleus nereidis TaxID=2735141 RepID=A0ABU3Z398_9EURY|nr:HEPN domain-containing protein [Methanoculleus sp. YWC-01]MDV4343279.1 HEPN domain-containing protein [Methanoculleus sp. YWC-01]